MGARTAKRKNPSELLIFGNPGKRGRKRRNGSIANHKPDCACPFCRRARGESPKARKANKVRIRVTQDAVSKKFTAVLHDSQFGDTYASGATKAAAVKALRSRVKGMRGAVARSANPTSNRRRRGTANRKGRATHAARPERRRLRNPSDGEQAVALFESFHGKDAREVIEKQRSAAMRLDYTALGPLIAFGFDDNGFPEKRLAVKWHECPHIDFEGDKVTLASAPNGRQLYCIGGNQNLDSSLSMFEGVDKEKDLIDLGDVFFVVYEARKIHDNFEPADYCHKFGGDGKTLPRLAYDKLKKEMLLIGGEYFISTKAGISPGIEG